MRRYLAAWHKRRTCIRYCWCTKYSNPSGYEPLSPAPHYSKLIGKRGRGPRYNKFKPLRPQPVLHLRSNFEQGGSGEKGSYFQGFEYLVHQRKHLANHHWKFRYLKPSAMRRSPQKHMNVWGFDYPWSLSSHGCYHDFDWLSYSSEYGC